MMKKGKLLVKTSAKGKIFVQLDRLDGKPPIPLSAVSFPDTKHDGKECEYESDKGYMIYIEGVQVWPHARVQQKQTAPQHQARRWEQPTPAKEPRGGADEPQDSYQLHKTLLPTDTRSKKLLDIDNFALKLNKAARYEMMKDKYKFLFHFTNTRDKRESFGIKANYGHLRSNFEQLQKRVLATVEAMKYGNKSLASVSFKPSWKLVLGLGGESVYETSMTLHHVYGIPYIPASSIKGVVRSWVISQIFASERATPEQERNYPLANAEYRAITGSRLFCALFGCPDEAKRLKFTPDGKPFDPSKKDAYDSPDKSAFGHEKQGEIVFFDAFPNTSPIVKADIMNAHYPDWYKEKDYKAPTDTQNPNPVPFLAISNENNLSFDIHLIASNVKAIDIDKNCASFMPSGSGLKPESSLLSDVAKFWLTQALSQHGLGAKTAVGYGYMN